MKAKITAYKKNHIKISFDNMQISISQNETPTSSVLGDAMIACQIKSQEIQLLPLELLIDMGDNFENADRCRHYRREK